MGIDKLIMPHPKTFV